MTRTTTNVTFIGINESERICRAAAFIQNDLNGLRQDFDCSIACDVDCAHGVIADCVTTNDIIAYDDNETDGTLSLTFVGFL